MKPIYNYLKSSFCLIAVLLVSCTEEYKYNTDYSFYEGVTLKMDLVDENNVLSVRLANSSHALTISVTPDDVFIDSKNQNIDEKIDTHRTNTVQIKIKTAL